MAYVYILECSDGSLYTGWTNDLKKDLRPITAAPPQSTPVQDFQFAWFTLKKQNQKAPLSNEKQRLKSFPELKSCLLLNSRGLFLLTALCNSLRLF